jgi:hypothetical protein
MSLAPLQKLVLVSSLLEGVLQKLVLVEQVQGGLPPLTLAQDQQVQDQQVQDQQVQYHLMQD